MAHRKLQQEIDRVFKKISEGCEVFDGLHERHEQAENPALREKIEAELKKEVKKLQKLREQVKVWQASSEVKDKDSLLTNRRKVEVAMEQYKVVEKGSKVKAYSNMSLRNREDMDPEEKEKMETIQFMQDSIEEIDRLYEVVDADVEKLSAKKGKKAVASAVAEKEELKLLQTRYRWHQQQLELALRLLENGQLDHSEFEPLKEDLEYFLQHSRDDDFVENEYMYESLDLDADANLQKEIAEGYGLIDETSVSPSPAKATREATPHSQPQLPQASISTPKSKKASPALVDDAVTSLIGSSSTLRPARVPAEQVKWSALAAGVDEAEKLREKEEKERKEREEREAKELEEREQREREQREREAKELQELQQRQERERLEREERLKREREEQHLRELERQRREEERKKREAEKREREERELEREREKERERERKRERRLQSLGLKDTEPQQIIITGSSPALLKRLEEQKRLEEEEYRLKKEQEDEQDESALSAPLDEAVFNKDAELALLPPGLQDIVCSYYDSRRTNDKVVSSVAQSCRPPRQFLPPTAVPSLTACVELNRALNIWSLVRPQVAKLGTSSTTTSAVTSVPTSPVVSSPSPPPSSSLANGSVPGLLSNGDVFTNLDNGTLFYAFYYALTPFETNIAEKELIKRSWRADSTKKCWFLRGNSTPVKQGQGFEVASYKKFDAETWSLQDLVNYKLDYDTLAVTV